MWLTDLDSNEMQNPYLNFQIQIFAVHSLNLYFLFEWFDLTLPKCIAFDL